MSGIAGIYQKNGAPLDSTVLRQMIDALSHRGGEGCETWGEGPVGLAIDQRKLLSEDCDYTLPLNVDDYVIVADARIDNREELLRQFDEPPHTWPHISDSLVILKSYAKWGAECPERLHGDFVFVIWDPHTKRLFCARDRIGVRPFYYVSTPELFCFASEIKALHRHPAVGRDLDEIRLANYIMARFEDKERTFYRQISRLPPAHSMIIDHAGLKIRPYWTPQLEPTFSGTFAEAAEQFRALLEDSVRARLRASTVSPIGFLISGGLDSSSVLTLASQNLDGAVPQTYFATFPDFPDIDETNWTDLLAQHVSFKKNSVRVDQLRPVTMLDEIYRHLDEPFHFPNLYIYWALAQEAACNGTKVLLDGMDGDTTVSHGMELLAQMIARGEWFKAARESRALARRFNSSAWRFAWHFGFAPAVGHHMRPIRSLLPSSHVLNPQFQQRIQWSELEQTYQAESQNDAAHARATHLKQLSSGILSYSLEVYDHAAASFGLDHRHPYYDARLISFCLGLPAEMKLRHGVDRAVQREALKPVLPPALRLRFCKSNWSENFQRSLISLDGELVRQFLTDPGAVESYVDIRQIRRNFDRMGNNGSLSVEQGLPLWTAISLGNWLRNC